MISTPLNRPRSTRLIVVAWLALLSIAVVMLVLSLNRLDAQRRQDAPDAQIAELQTRTLKLEAFRTAVEAAPAVVTESDFQQLREHWQQQWDGLKQHPQDFASATELAALQDRLDTVARQVSSTKPVAKKQRGRTATPRPAPKTPTFQALGVESRGGERFLAIQPNDTAGLASVRLLRVGDTEGRWQLEALDSRTAHFRIDRQSQHLPLPQE
ncbi:MAG TPA: hypothetical protein DIT33_00720 [Pseudomonas sp.]|uniref:hypothetical protein n=1 Tax=Pseudomonas sp. TaxID=306 RepID=UPI000EE2FBEA|nr:hypothetical protein [Pseudomonas sp.]HCN61907.1 hypothetical protein [Pseudomonas sp.]